MSKSVAILCLSIQSTIWSSGKELNPPSDSYWLLIVNENICSLEHPVVIGRKHFWKGHVVCMKAVHPNAGDVLTRSIIVFLANLNVKQPVRRVAASSHHYCSPNHFICSYCFLFAGLTDPELIHNCTYQFSVHIWWFKFAYMNTQRQRRMKDR